MTHLTRRSCLKALAAAGTSTVLSTAICARERTLPKSVSIRALTTGPKQHFFGYYGIPPWNLSGKRLVCLESTFQDHMPSPDEPAVVGLVDESTGTFRSVTETRAWNLQQGAMLHWNPLEPEHEVIFNDRNVAGDVVASVFDFRSNRKRHLPRAVSAVARTGRYALSLTYGRLTRLRTVVGYPGTVDPNPDDPAPANDGVFLMDLESGKVELVVPIAEVHRRLVERHPEIKEKHMWFNHTVFNKDASRFFFLARNWKEVDGRRQLESAMFTANRDGTELREVVPYGLGVSHFEWRNNSQILATFRREGQMRHVMFTDGKEDYEIVGKDVLIGDGHCSFAPGEKWIATDRGHFEKRAKSLWVYNVETKTVRELGVFPVGNYYGGDLRCDLHPRWNRTGDAICFDALEKEKWTRQLHVAYLEW